MKKGIPKTWSSAALLKGNPHSFGLVLASQGWIRIAPMMLNPENEHGNLGSMFPSFFPWTYTGSLGLHFFPNSSKLRDFFPTKLWVHLGQLSGRI